MKVKHFNFADKTGEVVTILAINTPLAWKRLAKEFETDITTLKKITGARLISVFVYKRRTTEAHHG